MQTLRVFESISIDGYFVDADGDMSWAHAGSADDADFAAFVSANAGSGADLLFGRKTYEMMAAFWPTPQAARQMPAVAAGMNAARKLVATTTIEPTWTNSARLAGELVAAVRERKAQRGPGLTVLGSGSVAAQLGAAGLVDEYQFVVVPIALGGGRTVFTTGRPLRLVDHRVFRCGNLVVTYAVA